MNRLSKEKRDQLILVGLGTLLLVGLIIFFLIRPQYAAVARVEAQTRSARNQLQSMEEAIKMAGTVSTQLVDMNHELVLNQGDLVTGDPAQWIYNTIRNFKGHYDVDIAVNSQLSKGVVDLLPHFPYKQLKVSVGGTAYYHDLGKFIADFENTFPHVRIANLTLAPAGSAGHGTEKLNFRMDIIALENSGGPQG